MQASKSYDVIIIGAGAAGMMAAITAGKRGKKVLLLERNKKPGAKILISGGGRCNFTNQDTEPGAYISENPHFAKSALSRYTPWDFMDLMAAHGLSWHEKTLGQLFCDQSAKAIVSMFLEECTAAGVDLKLQTDVVKVGQEPSGFSIRTSDTIWEAGSLVIATGGTAIPQMGATDFGYRLARQFGLRIVEPLPALVPLVFDPQIVAGMKNLAGVAADCNVSVPHRKHAPVFRENILFTHRGLSGPAILQISSYWSHGDSIAVNLLPVEADVLAWLKKARETQGASSVKAVLRSVLPDRLADQIAEEWPDKMADQSNQSLQALTERLSAWSLKPTGTEGLKKAEVTKGGVSTESLSSKTMEVKSVPGLYFIGECVDVTGWLGGYNFQWAWASGYAAGQAV